MQPPVGDGAHDVLAEQRLEERHRKGEHVRLVHLLFVEQKVFGVVDALVLIVLDPDPEGLNSAADAIAPREGRLDAQRDAQYSSRDRLCLHFDFEPRKLADELLDEEPRVVLPDQRADFLVVHVPEVLEGEVLLLEPVAPVGRHDVAKLAQGVLLRPDALRHHLVEREQLVGKRDEAFLKAELEEGAEDAAGALDDVIHVGDEREPVHLRLRNVGLQQDVHFGNLINHQALALDRLHFNFEGAGVGEELDELLVLLVARLHVFELGGACHDFEAVGLAHRWVYQLVV